MVLLSLGLMFAGAITMLFLIFKSFNDFVSALRIWLIGYVIYLVGFAIARFIEGGHE